ARRRLARLGISRILFRAGPAPAAYHPVVELVFALLPAPFGRGFCESIVGQLPWPPLAASARRPLEHGGPDDLGLDPRAARQPGDFMDRRALESPREIFTRRRRDSAPRRVGHHPRPERGERRDFFPARLRADLWDGIADHGRPQ